MSFPAEGKQDAYERLPPRPPHIRISPLRCLFDSVLLSRFLFLTFACPYSCSRLGRDESMLRDILIRFLFPLLLFPLASCIVSTVLSVSMFCVCFSRANAPLVSSTSLADSHSRSFIPALPSMPYFPISLPLLISVGAFNHTGLLLLHSPRPLAPHPLRSSTGVLCLVIFTLSAACSFLDLLLLRLSAVDILAHFPYSPFPFHCVS